LKPDLEVIGSDVMACSVEQVEGEGRVDPTAEKESDVKRSRVWFTSVGRNFYY